MNEISESFAVLMPADNEGIHNYLGDLMYVAEGVDVHSESYRSTDVRSHDKNVRIFNETRKGFDISTELINRSNREAKVIFPLWYYPGYKLYSTASSVTMSANEVNEIVVKIPPHFEGTVNVRFEEPWYWRIAEAVSLLSLAVFLSVYGVSRR